MESCAQAHLQSNHRVSVLLRALRVAAGGPRVSGRGVDMGCYELFTPSGLNIIVR